MRIGVDAMGGDFAPGVVVEGLVKTLVDHPSLQIALVGHAQRIGFYLEKYGLTGHPSIEVFHAPSVCEMSDPSTISLRAKRDSSITLLAKMLKEKSIDAMVTPGHTGATVAATKVLVRTLPGVDRAALGASMPARSARFLLIDAGANTDCKPHHLVQFALMGGVYAQYLYRTDRPRIGLLSVGGEDIKGSELTKETFKRLEKLPINFIGNIEADEAFKGVADVIVCDGFTGNVMLKTAEGLGRTTVFWLKQVLKQNAVRLLGAALAKNAFTELKAYSASDVIGGAPLLGLNGICIIGHGGSNPLAVCNAIRVASECVKFGLNDRICKAVESAGELAQLDKLPEEEK